MAKRRMGIMAVILCFFLCLMPCTAFAAFTTDAKEPILTDNNGTLTVSYRYDGVAFSGQPVKLYKIANVSADAQYAPVTLFAASGLVLNGIRTQGEWNVIRSTLEAYILANNIEPIVTGVTDENGQICFTNQKPGLYMVSAIDVVEDELTCSFSAALVALPGLDVDGHWQYQLSLAPKPEARPPISPDEEIQYKVLKLWKGDEGRTDRPESIEIEIFRDGSIFETVVLSEENHWSYSWTVEDDGSSWSVIERNIPEGYSMTLEDRGTTFVLTNSRIPGNSDTPSGGSPQTGDTFNPLLYTVLAFVCGTGLIILGITGKRKRHEETT